MTKDEALDLALEALEVIIHWYGVRDKNDVMMPPLNQNPEIKESMDAITAIKQARALDKMAENARELGLDYEPAEVLGHNGWGFPIKSAAPVQEDWGPGPHECHSLTAAPVQEPVWIRPDDLQKAQRAPFLCRVEPNKRDDFVPLYTTPPAAQRQWVGLTDEDVDFIADEHATLQGAIRAIEAKLKEKNGGKHD